MSIRPSPASARSPGRTVPPHPRGWSLVASGPPMAEHGSPAPAGMVPPRASVGSKAAPVPPHLRGRSRHGLPGWRCNGGSPALAGMPPPHSSQAKDQPPRSWWPTSPTRSTRIMKCDRLSPAASAHTFYGTRRERGPQAQRSWPVEGGMLKPTYRRRPCRTPSGSLRRHRHALACAYSLRWQISPQFAHAVETQSHRGVVIEWSGQEWQSIRKRELAVFDFKDGRTAEASCSPSYITNDHAFRGKRRRLAL